MPCRGSYIHEVKHWGSHKNYMRWSCKSYSRVLSSLNQQIKLTYLIMFPPKSFTNVNDFFDIWISECISSYVFSLKQHVVNKSMRYVKQSTTDLIKYNITCNISLNHLAFLNVIITLLTRNFITITI